MLNNGKSISIRIHHLALYLIVGGWNTLFGIGIYALLYGILHSYVNYLVLAIPANVLAITNAYFSYKFFVFKTRGNYVREYLRCYLVYGGSTMLGLALMYILVSIFGLHPVLAQSLCVIISIVSGYMGHKRFTFGDGSV